MGMVTNDFSIKISKADVAELTKPMSNWRTAFDYMKALPDNDESVLQLYKMMKLELARGKDARYQILHRIQMRLSTVRSRIERARWEGAVKQK